MHAGAQILLPPRHFRPSETWRPPWPALDWTLTAAEIAIGRGLDDVRGGGGAQNGSSMPPPGLLHAGLWLSRAMSQCVLEPRPPGKRWLVSAVEGDDVEAPGS